MAVEMKEDDLQALLKTEAVLEAFIASSENEMDDKLILSLAYVNTRCEMLSSKRSDKGDLLFKPSLDKLIKIKKENTNMIDYLYER